MKAPDNNKLGLEHLSTVKAQEVMTEATRTLLA
jgi:hypothetical protein